jgi:aminoglycoside phosphotransferase (APT) family kinase protein
MTRRPTTLVHGDLATVNMAPAPDELVLLDWSMTAVAPGPVDIARFIAGCSSVVDLSREDVIAAYRSACASYDEQAMRLALLTGLLWLGWNKALDARENPDPAIKAREAEDLGWWLDRGREAFDAGLT